MRSQKVEDKIFDIVSESSLQQNFITFIHESLSEYGDNEHLIISKYLVF